MRNNTTNERWTKMAANFRPPLSGLCGFIVSAVLVSACAVEREATASDADSGKICAAFQAKLEGIQLTAGFPGATAALSLPDGTLCEAASGLADLEQDIAMDDTHRMPAGSIGKTFVAAAALSLMMEGAIDYDDKAMRWLGDKSWFGDWPNADDITIGHLLTHTSGVATDYIADPEMLALFNQAIAEDKTLSSLGVTHEDYAKAVSGTAPSFPAGEGFHYTDVSYVLVALIVEEVSGQSLEVFVQEKFLTPLNLNDIAPQKREMKNIAAGYIPAPYRDAFGGVPEKSLTDDGVFVYDPEFEWGGGGYVSTAGDLALWARAWFGGEAISGDYLDVQRSNIDARAIETLQAGYGPGIQHLSDERLGERYFHRGYMLGYISVTEYLPSHDVALSMMINTIDTQYTTYHNDLMRESIAVISASAN
ncbi:serine hydrolase [Hyphococcus flavus]|uniref:Serine hydrolase n=1 Tax=Hyphococcus flavus TaxID=1866326 RepID=A0AAE9ZDF5_9PROT|nr:serine hydrolase domain-containing protein [Hyphococcus flavus]WDI32719.1 serine hydrolase [Hyphococcus flavus]